MWATLSWPVAFVATQMESKMFLMLGALLGALFTQCKGQKDATLTLLSTRNYTYAKEGTNVTVVCEVTNLAGKTVRWIHKDEQVALIANGNRVVFMDPSDETKYSLRGAQSSGGNFTFTIHNVSSNDVGKVTCDVNEATPATKLIYLFDAPDIVQLTFISNQSTFENRQPGLSTLHVSNNEWVNLTCTAINSRPFAMMTWHWNDSNLFSDLNYAAETFVSEIDDVYNTSSVLQLPPGFSTILFGNPMSYTVMSKENLSTHVTTAFSSTNPSSQPFVTPNNRVSNSLITDGWLSEKEEIDLMVKVTCKAVFQGEVVSQSLQIHVGPYGGEGPRMQIHKVMWVIYIISFKAFW